MVGGVISPGTLFWAGEHWINFLRRPGAEDHSGMVSRYHTQYSSAGEGIVALVHVDAPEQFTAICSNNPALVPFIQDHWPRARIPPFNDQEIPVLEATFSRGGDTRYDPSWTIAVDGHEVVARWGVTQQPLTMNRSSQTQASDMDLHSQLFFTTDASITFDGQDVKGSPYETPHWAPLLGTGQSSCVFALAETMVQTLTS